MYENIIVSIGMPMFNAERTVAQTICSILNQDFQEWELLIIDDGSIDSGPLIAKSFRDNRIRIVQGVKNLGLPARLNETIALSRGEYFARMDADDIAYPHRLTRQLEYLRSQPEIDLAGGSLVIFQGDGTLLGGRPACTTHQQICGNIIRAFALAHVTWMGKTEWFRRNPYHNGKKLAQDRDLLIRCHRHSCFGAVPDVLVGVREDKAVRLRALVKGRYEVARALVQDGVVNRDCRHLLAAFVEMSKLGFDAAALGIGLNYHLLNHRAQKLDLNTEREWRAVWAQVNGMLNHREC